MDSITTQTLILGGTGLLCGAILAVAAKYLAVHEDPKIEAVTGMLAGINCGACGFTSCAAYAKGIVENGLPLNLCQPGGGTTVGKLAAFMGVAAEAKERTTAIVLCGGDDTQARRLSLYNGIADCWAAELVGGGGKGCRYGCLGFGSCSRACPVNAIEIRNRLAVVHPDLCISCGRCVTACPRRMIKLVPESRAIHILCVSRDRGPDVKRVCDVGCIACTRCVKTVGGQGISMDGHLAVVDYSVPLANEDVIAACPMHTIVKRSGQRPGVP